MGHQDGAAQSSSPRPRSAVKDPREQAWWILMCEMEERNGGMDEKRCSKQDTLFLCFSFEVRALMCMLRYSSGMGQQCVTPTSNSCNKWPGVSSVITEASGLAPSTLCTADQRSAGWHCPVPCGIRWDLPVKLLSSLTAVFNNALSVCNNIEIHSQKARVQRAEFSGSWYTETLTFRWLI